MPGIRTRWNGEAQLGIRLYRNDTGRTHLSLQRNAAGSACFSFSDLPLLCIYTKGSRIVTLFWGLKHVVYIRKRTESFLKYELLEFFENLEFKKEDFVVVFANIINKQIVEVKYPPEIRLDHLLRNLMPLDYFFSFFFFLSKIIHHSSSPYLQGFLLKNPIDLVNFVISSNVLGL